MTKFVAKFRKDRDIESYDHVLMKHQKYEQKKTKNQKWFLEDIQSDEDDLDIEKTDE